MCALAPTVAPWPQFLLANEDQIENAGNIFLATLPVSQFPAAGCFSFNLLRAVAVGCLRRERPHTSMGAELSSFHTPGQEPRWHQIPTLWRCLVRNGTAKPQQQPSTAWGPEPIGRPALYCLINATVMKLNYHVLWYLSVFSGAVIFEETPRLFSCDPFWK